MDYDDNFDEEQMTKLLNSQISMLSDKFKLYDKMIYEENANKIILPYYKIRYNDNLSKEVNVEKMNSEFEKKQSYYENNITKLNNLLSEKEKLIKILQEDLASTEKKYHESIKEKEALKTLLNRRTNNTKSEVIQSIVHEESLNSERDINSHVSLNKLNQDAKKTFNQITINNNTNINNTNNHFNILSNYKNNAMGINSRNKAKSRAYIDTSKLNDSEENKMNMTIDINNKPSNFAMFNNNLTSRNNKKVSSNKVNKAETIIYDEDTFRKEFGNNQGNNNLNSTLIMKKTVVGNKDKEYFERQINSLNSKLDKLQEENKKHLDNNTILEQENLSLKEKLDLLNSKYQILLKEKESTKLLKESIANANNNSNTNLNTQYSSNLNYTNINNITDSNSPANTSNQYPSNASKSNSSIYQEQEENRNKNISQINSNSNNKTNLTPDPSNNINILKNNSSNIKESERANYSSLNYTASSSINLRTGDNSFNSNINDFNLNNYNGNYNTNSGSTQGRTSLKENSVDTRLSKYDIKSNMKRRTSVHSQQKNNQNTNENRQLKNNLVSVNNNLKTNNFNNSSSNSNFNSNNNNNESLATSILNRGENKRLSELQSNYRESNNINNRNFNQRGIPNVNINLGASSNLNNLSSIKNDQQHNTKASNNDNHGKSGGLFNKITNLFSKK